MAEEKILKNFHWGILGTAEISRLVVPAIQSQAGMSVRAVASRSQTRAASFASDYGIATAHDSYEALLADPTIDAIYNPLPNDMHVEWTIRALEAGKHVLCEKPIALNEDEAKLLLRAQQKTGKFVKEAFMVRHHPQWIEASDLVRRGELGEVRAIQTYFGFYNHDGNNIRNLSERGGGALYDVGCYAVATARYIFDGEPINVIGVFDNDPNFNTDRLTSGLLEFPGGRHLTFTVSTQIAPSQRVVIFGEKARLEIRIPFNAPADRPMLITIDDGSDLEGLNARRIEFPSQNQYGLQAASFVRDLEIGRPEFPLEDAVRNMRVLDALKRSQRTKTLEKL